jgi:hypothetical protein
VRDEVAACLGAEAEVNLVMGTNLTSDVVASEENETLESSTTGRSGRVALGEHNAPRDDMPKSLGKRPRSGEEKRPSPPKCPHGKSNRGYLCKECPGKGICEHGRVRYSCKECGGSGICDHGRRRSQCKECGGGGICDHGRRRTQCKECGGGSICEHGRQRYICKECGGSGICEHGRQRSKCKECREARAASARAIPPPFRLKPEAGVVPAIKREPSDTSDPGVDPDAAEAPEIKSEPSDATDPGSVDSRLDRA